MLFVDFMMFLWENNVSVIDYRMLKVPIILFFCGMDITRISHCLYEYKVLPIQVGIAFDNNGI